MKREDNIKEKPKPLTIQEFLAKYEAGKIDLAEKLKPLLKSKK